MAKYDALPNISVNLKQIKVLDANLTVPFNATVICKTKTGPIGEFTHISSYTEAVNIFGLGDASTPVLYGVEQVLKTYGYINIIRLASAQAAKASVKLKVKGEDSHEEIVETYVPVDTTTTPFDPTKTYYVSKDGDYVVATKTVDTYTLVPEGSSFGPTVTYYVLKDGSYVIATKEVDVYTEVEAGTEFDPTVTYYTTEDGETYVEAEGISEFDPDTTYYTKSVEERPITEFEEGIDYYTKSTTEEPITEFEEGVIYYTLEETIIVDGIGTLIEGTSDYKTDIYNGDEIKLVYNAVRTRLCLKATLNGTDYTTPLEIIDLSTATAPELEKVLDKLVTNWNALNTGITLENKFINKVDTDETLTPEDEVVGTIQLGNSGNAETISNADVISYFELLEDPRIITQDVVCVPEFRNYEVVNAGLAIRNKYFYIVAAQGNDLASKQDYITNYEASDKGVLYIPDTCTMADTSIDVPFEVAVLYAWATSFNASRYLAPAGTTRATLPLVTEVKHNLPDDDAVVLYNDRIPANPVKYITDYGYTLYGQKTMDASQVFTNRINVSGLVSYIKIEGEKMLTPYLFEYTPVSTFQKVYLDIDKLLSTLATKEVLYDDYKIVCDESNNTKETLANHELHVAIAIRPVNVTEYIIVDLTVTDDIGGEE